MGAVALNLLLVATYDHTGGLAVPSAPQELPSASMQGTCEFSIACTGYNGTTMTALLEVSNDPTALSSPSTAAWTTPSTYQVPDSAGVNVHAYCAGEDSDFPGILDLRPFRFIRASCTKTPSGLLPTADATFTGWMRVIRETPGSIILHTSTSTFDVDTVTWTPSSPFEVAQADATVMGVQVVTDCADYGTDGNIDCQIQVSNDPSALVTPSSAKWKDLPGAVTTRNANGNEFLAGSDTSNPRVIPIQGYRYVRLVGRSGPGGDPAADATVTAWVKIQRQDAGTSS